MVYRTNDIQYTSPSRISSYEQGTFYFVLSEAMTFLLRSKWTESGKLVADWSVKLVQLPIKFHETRYVLAKAVTTRGKNMEVTGETNMRHFLGHPYNAYT